MHLERWVNKLDLIEGLCRVPFLQNHVWSTYYPWSSFPYPVSIFSFRKGGNESVPGYIKDFYVSITYSPYPLENLLENNILKTWEEIRCHTMPMVKNCCAPSTLGVSETNAMWYNYVQTISIRWSMSNGFAISYESSVKDNLLVFNDRFH